MLWSVSRVLAQGSHHLSLKTPSLLVQLYILIMIRNIFSSDSLCDSKMDRKARNNCLLLPPELSDMSQNSLLNHMRRFNSTVQNMEDTILVPSRLIDMDMTSYPDNSADGDVTQRHVTSLLRDCDAYDAFHALRAARTQLYSGPSSTSCGGGGGGGVGGVTLKLRRSLSTFSAQSVCSDFSDENEPAVPSGQNTVSSSVSSAVMDDDSGVDEAANKYSDSGNRDGNNSSAGFDSGDNLQHEFSHHLAALCDCLVQMSHVADYLSSRYEQQINTVS